MRSPSTESINVLHLDDEPDFVELAAEFLDRHDCLNIETTANASDALDMLREDRYDCVVSDFDMPGKDGIEFLESVRGEFPDLPFILYTGKGSEEVASDAISAGVTEYIQKEAGTSHYEVLANRIFNAVEKYRAQDELQDREERLNLFFEQSPLGVIRWDDEFNFARLNDRAREILGYEKGELLGEPWDVVIPEADRDEIGVVVVEDLLANEGGYHSINQNVRKDGNRIICEWHNWVVTDENDEVVAVFSQVQDITGQRRRERRFEAIFNNTYSYIGLLETDGALLEVNETALAFGEVASEEVVGTPIWETYWFQSSEEAQAAAKEGIERASRGEMYREEIRVQGANQDVIIDFTIRPITDDQGDVTLLVAEGRNITQRKEREETLSEIVERTRDLIDAESESETAQIAIDIVSDVLNAPLAGIHLLSEDAQRLEAVAAVDEVRDEFGVPPTYDREGSGAADETVWDAFESGEPLFIKDITEHGQLAEETPARSVVIQPLADHGVLLISSTDTEAFDETDRDYIELLGRTVTAALDRSEREATLRTRNRQLEQLHDVGQELIQADTRDGIATLVAEGSEEILDNALTLVRYYDEAENGLVPVASTEASGEICESRPTFDAEGWSLNWAAYESGTPSVYQDISNINRAVDSGSQIRSLMILPLGEHGTVSMAAAETGAFDESDVSQAQLLVTTAELALSQLEHEAEIIRQRDALNRQNERLEDFASIVSHDLRNPLNVAQGRLELAEEECESGHLEAIKRSHTRMELLIQDLLSLARSGKSVAEPESIELSALVESCWRNVETATATLDIQSQASIQADQSRLRQLLENLIRNAVEHGGEDVTVTVGDLDSGFYVADNGPGIPNDERDDVVKAGYSTATEGTGFGLSIVRDVARAHSWEMEITSSSADGVRFEFRNVKVI